MINIQGVSNSLLFTCFFSNIFENIRNILVNSKRMKIHVNSMFAVAGYSLSLDLIYKVHFHFDKFCLQPHRIELTLNFKGYHRKVRKYCCVMKYLLKYMT